MSDDRDKPEELAAELERLRTEIEALDATSEEKGVVRLGGDLGGTADNPTVPALSEIEELRATRARLLEDKRKGAEKDVTASREDAAAELERLREQARVSIEARRIEIAAEVEAARVAAEKSALGERHRLATAVEEAHSVELARVHWRIDAHDEHFGTLNGSVEKLAGAVEHQAKATAELRLEMQTRFAEQIQVALKAESTTRQLAADAKRESRKLMLQISSAVLVACITAAATIIVALLSSAPA